MNDFVQIVAYDEQNEHHKHQEKVFLDLHR